jgi:hypothetical protein
LKADIVVAAGPNAPASVDAVYQSGGVCVGRVFVITDPVDDVEPLRVMRDDGRELVLLQNETPLGMVASWNRGIFLSERDVLLLGGNAVLAGDCLAEMLDVLRSSDRIGSVAPLITERTVDLRDLPRSTDLPTSNGLCMLLRHTALNMIGALDPALPDANDAQDDWTMRAQRMGLRHVRANRALVVVRDLPGSHPLRDPAALVLRRHPHLPEQIDVALRSAETSSAAHFLATRSAGPRFRTRPDTHESEGFQVLYRSTPIEDAAQLLGLIDTRWHLVLGRPAAYRNRTLLFAAARAAQAIVVSSQREREMLSAELALDPARFEVLDSTGDLDAVFRRVVDHPNEDSLRYRTLLVDSLRSR